MTSLRCGGIELNSALFFDFLTSISERSRNFLARRNLTSGSSQTAGQLIELCDAVLSGRGEASGAALASEILDRYGNLNAVERLIFFQAFADKFGPDRAKLIEVAEAWLRDPLNADASELHFCSEARRQELLRRLNLAPNGTHSLVKMREDLLALMVANPNLGAVDHDFIHLLNSWFNRGFLVLRRIDWSTPAIVLEKIIRYEAVHEIRGFADLRRRIDPIDRRCYGFFHPALIDEPLIFVEVALTETMPGAIEPLLVENRTPVQLDKARTAVFYSISNCQAGLAGITFGNFLIKQVVEDLRRELPRLDYFVTLSPVPGFMRWLKSDTENTATLERRDLLASLENSDWSQNGEEAARLRRSIEPLAAHYLLNVKRSDGRPLDSVARFHLGNGARLERINWQGDLSPQRLRDSAGLMVNYLYDLDQIEENHEAFANHGEVAASAAVKKLSKPESKSRLAQATALAFG
jgi:malonyl-CoA decarboxylase